MYLAIAAHSEIGLVRKNNQDSGYISPTMLLVCDGMGGAAAGDLASTVATQTLSGCDGNYTGEAMLDVLSAGLDDANDVILDLVNDNPDLKGMGTTVCGALFDGSQLGIIHIGDSRGYRFRDGELIRITHDHSWVQSLMDEGKITEAEAALHPHRSLLLKVLNG
ncbi:MAG: PP2C family protein-serine/threonine phosphatase, partial [Propionibacteriaceae bacterium]